MDKNKHYLLNQEELSKDDLRHTAEIALEIGVFDVLPVYNFKNFHAIKSGLKFNIPTNKYKSNRCSIFYDEDIYKMSLTSEYFDNSKLQLISNPKLEMSFNSLQDTSVFIFKELVKF